MLDNRQRVTSRTVRLLHVPALCVPLQNGYVTLEELALLKAPFPHGVIPATASVETPRGSPRGPPYAQGLLASHGSNPFVCITALAESRGDLGLFFLRI